MERKKIGGELTIDFKNFNFIKKNKKNIIPPGGTWTINGRTSLYLILQTLRKNGVKHIHLPSFLCKSILQPVKELNLSYSFYPVKENLNIQPDPPSKSALLLIHYFGKTNINIKNLYKQFSPSIKIIEDTSHIYLNKNYNTNKNSYTFFSMRKHLASAVGGWCNLKKKIEPFSNEAEKFLWMSLSARYLKSLYLENNEKPINKKIENFYLDIFKQNESFMNKKNTVFGIPDCIKSLILNFNIDSIRQKRIKNWKRLDSIIGNKVKKVFDFNNNDNEVPFGYIIQLEKRDKLKKLLAQKRIFSSIHWPQPTEIKKALFPFSTRLSNQILTLPISQNYSETDMEKLGKIFLKIL